MYMPQGQDAKAQEGHVHLIRSPAPLEPGIAVPIKLLTTLPPGNCHSHLRLRLRLLPLLQDLCSRKCRAHEEGQEPAARKVLE
jgi:hypothetical protein